MLQAVTEGQAGRVELELSRTRQLTRNQCHALVKRLKKIGGVRSAFLRGDCIYVRATKSSAVELVGKETTRFFRDIDAPPAPPEHKPVRRRHKVEREKLRRKCRLHKEEIRSHMRH